LYVKKICWFTQRVIHYFVTIPICTCLLLNIIMLIFVVKRLIEHVRNSTTTHRTHQRLTRSVLVLIASCVTQGIGWLFGPFLTFVDENTANILGWFFVVFNGLEGFWTVILYIILRQMRVDDRIRRVPAEQITSETTIETRESRYERRRKRDAASVTRPDPIEPRETLYERRRRREAASETKPDPIHRRNASRTSHSFNDLHTMGEEL
jgi:hypothetical protein